NSATAPGSRLPAHLLAKGADPVVGGLPLGLGVASAGGAVLTGGRVGTEELHAGQLGVEIAEAVGDDFVVDVALEVDDEAVLPQRLLGGPRRQPREVDVAGRELAEDGVQAAGAVGVLEAHDARLVVAADRRYGLTRDQHKAGGVLLAVLDVGGDDLEA